MIDIITVASSLPTVVDEDIGIVGIGVEMKCRITAMLVIAVPRFVMHFLKTAVFSFENVFFVDADVFEVSIESLQIPVVL